MSAVKVVTPHNDINTLLEALLGNIQDVLKEHFLGMYLHGSLASGDFDPKRSDIDFLVVTKGTLPAELVSNLHEMHNSINDCGIKWVKRLEGSYIPKKALRVYDANNSHHPALCVGGNFGIEPHGSDWIIQRHIIREHGLVIAGPLPSSFIELVTPEQLRCAVTRTLREWWSAPLPSSERFDSSEYQVYAVLTMCRALHTLQYGRVASKPVAARWALKVCGKKWSPLIAAALQWMPNNHFNRKVETLDFVHYTVEHS